MFWLCFRVWFVSCSQVARALVFFGPLCVWVFGCLFCFACVFSLALLAELSGVLVFFLLAAVCLRILQSCPSACGGYFYSLQSLSRLASLQEALATVQKRCSCVVYHFLWDVPSLSCVVIYLLHVAALWLPLNSSLGLGFTLLLWLFLGLWSQCVFYFCMHSV